MGPEYYGPINGLKFNSVGLGKKFEENLVPIEGRFNEGCWQPGLLPTPAGLPLRLWTLGPDMESKEILEFQED